MAHRDFRGKVVLVTGAAGGLGRALCLRFAAAGARIAALDLNAPALAGLLSELGTKGVEAAGFECDITIEEACAQAVGGALARFGGIDVLVNNAGLSHRSAFARTRPAVLRRVIEVNCLGAVYCTHAALASLLERRGLIIGISSVAGFAPLVARTGYAASKHALHGFLESLRVELDGTGAEVMMVCPSFIRTGIDRNALGADGAPARHAQVVTGRRAEPEEIADAVYRAACAGRRLVLPGFTAKASYLLSRIAPAFYDRVMARRLRAEMAEDA